MKQAAYKIGCIWRVSDEFFSSCEDANEYGATQNRAIDKIIWPARFRLVEILSAVNTPNNHGGLEKIYELELVVPE